MAEKTSKMIPITAQDESMYRTLLFMTKLKPNNSEIKEKLHKEYVDHAEDLNVALSYVTYCFLASNTADMMEVKELTEEALDVLDEIIEVAPDSWLARYNRIKILLYYPSSFRNEDEIIEDIEYLIKLQNEAEYAPYFVLPYLLYAELLFDMDEITKSNEYIDKAYNMQLLPVGLLGDFLYAQVLGFVNKLEGEDEFEEADKLKEIAEKLFPEM